MSRITHSRCPQCGMHPIQGIGRHSTISDDTISAILTHHADPTTSAAEFCRKHSITYTIYKNVTGLRYKHADMQQRILSVAQAIGYNGFTQHNSELLDIL